MEEIQAQIERMAVDLKDLQEWKAEREQTQLKEPVDDASKVAIGALIDDGGANIATTVSLPVAAAPTSILVARVPTGFRAVRLGSSQFYIATYTP